MWSPVLLVFARVQAIRLARRRKLCGRVWFATCNGNLWMSICRLCQSIHTVQTNTIACLALAIQHLFVCLCWCECRERLLFYMCLYLHTIYVGVWICTINHKVYIGSHKFHIVLIWNNVSLRYSENLCQIPIHRLFLICFPLSIYSSLYTIRLDYRQFV